MLETWTLLFLLSGDPTFKADVKPIVEKRCMPCHTGQIKTLPDFTVYKTAFDKRYLIQGRVGNKTMPPGNSTNMTDKERQVIKDWVKSGAKE